LFDDPLSALDSHTGNHIFDHVISNNGVLKSSTRILVTHRNDVAQKADFILVMEEGKITKFGPPNAV
jgi:ABC-type multidrug transport system fused ATPase/permease subunit